MKEKTLATIIKLIGFSVIAVAVFLTAKGISQNLERVKIEGRIVSIREGETTVGYHYLDKAYESSFHYSYSEFKPDASINVYIDPAQPEVIYGPTLFMPLVFALFFGGFFCIVGFMVSGDASPSGRSAGYIVVNEGWQELQTSLVDIKRLGTGSNAKCLVRTVWVDPQTGKKQYFKQTIRDYEGPEIGLHNGAVDFAAPQCTVFYDPKNRRDYTIDLSSLVPAAGFADDEGAERHSAAPEAPIMTESADGKAWKAPDASLEQTIKAILVSESKFLKKGSLYVAAFFGTIFVALGIAMQNIGYMAGVLVILGVVLVRILRSAKNQKAAGSGASLAVCNGHCTGKYIEEKTETTHDHTGRGTRVTYDYHGVFLLADGSEADRLIAEKEFTLLSIGEAVLFVQIPGEAETRVIFHSELEAQRELSAEQNHTFGWREREGWVQADPDTRRKLAAYCAKQVRRKTKLMPSAMAIFIVAFIAFLVYIMLRAEGTWANKIIPSVLFAIPAYVIGSFALKESTNQLKLKPFPIYYSYGTKKYGSEIQLASGHNRRTNQASAIKSGEQLICISTCLSSKWRDKWQQAQDASTKEANLGLFRENLFIVPRKMMDLR